MNVLVAMILLVTVAAALTSALPTDQERQLTLVPDLQEVQRSRRSPDDKKAPGGFGVDIYEEDKVGVVGKVHGHGTVWQSDDGKSRVEAHGQWSKVLDGPQRSKPHHNAGISFSHDFGDD